MDSNEVKTIKKDENCELIELEIPEIKEKAEEIRKLGIEICKKAKIMIKLDDDGYRTMGANELRKLGVENFDEIKTEEIKKCREELEKIAVEPEPIPEPKIPETPEIPKIPVVSQILYKPKPEPVAKIEKARKTKRKTKGVKAKKKCIC